MPRIVKENPSTDLEILLFVSQEVLIFCVCLFAEYGYVCMCVCVCVCVCVSVFSTVIGHF